MTAGQVAERAWVVGTGRLGLALGWMALQVRAVDVLTFIGRTAPPAHPVLALPAASFSSLDALPPEPPDLLLLTVPDDAIAGVAERLASLGVSPRVALHTSGVLSGDALSALAEKGAATGSLHPLVAIPDAITSAEKLRGAWYGIEGSPIAMRQAAALVAALEGHALPLAPEGKPVYHAAAVFASNFVVTLLHAAADLMERGGVERRAATAALATLAAGAVSDVEANGTEKALTGPILRGDARTIELHLARLSPQERSLYSVLARETLEIARSRGLSPERAQRLASVIEGWLS